VQLRVIVAADFRRILRELHHKLEHHAILFGYCCAPVVFPQSGHKLVVQRDATQKLCVRLDSIKTPVRNRDDGRDHFVLPPRKRQFWGHKRPERRERMVERVGYQSVRRDYP
jgi:hypothetical protein